MIYKLLVPAAVPGVEEIRVMEWHGEPGAEFQAGDLIVELETHKAVVEARAGQPGFLRKVNAEPGDWCAIGLVLAIFSDAPDEPLPEGDDFSDLKIEFDVI